MFSPILSKRSGDTITYKDGRALKPQRFQTQTYRFLNLRVIFRFSSSLSVLTLVFLETMFFLFIRKIQWKLESVLIYCDSCFEDNFSLFFFKSTNLGCAKMSSKRALPFFHIFHELTFGNCLVHGSQACTFNLAWWECPILDYQLGELVRLKQFVKYF